LLIFIILIAILVLVVIIIILIFWCCRPRSENAEDSKVVNIEKSTTILEKEVSKTESNLAALEKNVAKLEQTLGNSEIIKFNHEKQQALLQAEQERLKENSNYLGSTLTALQEKMNLQERNLMDEKVARVEKSLLLLSADNDEKRNKPYIVDEEFQRLGFTVSSVKDTVINSENQIKEILSKLEKLVSKYINW
jgi:chromosome segregation ATPase